MEDDVFFPANDNARIQSQLLPTTVVCVCMQPDKERMPTPPPERTSEKLKGNDTFSTIIQPIP